MGADVGMLIVGIIAGVIVGLLLCPDCPRYRPKYWERDE